MSRDSERARAKVNLTLRVLGKRPDGFHEIESLAAFADVCDVIEITHSAHSSLSLCGPFASSLGDDENIVLRALKAFNDDVGGIPDIDCRVRKAIPVAAGLGGGSADAAAALRLFSRVNTDCVSASRLQSLAAAIGSDVAVCLASSAAMMRGRGERTKLLEGFPALPAVLVNPGVALSTADVYAALSADSIGESISQDGGDVPEFASRRDVVDYMVSHGNDLESAAIGLQPVVGEVLQEVSNHKGCLIAQMSGSGPTCFGIFDTGACADQAAHALAEQHPDWWVRKTILS